MLLLTRCYGRRVDFKSNPVPIGWFDAEQVMDEEVIQQSLAERSARAVTAARHKKKIKLLVGLNQRVDDLQRRRRIDVCVHLPNYEKELALKPSSVIYI